MARGVSLIFLANTKSAIRDINQLGTAGKRMGKDVRKGSEESAASIKALGRTTEKTRALMSGLLGVAGVGGLAYGLKGAAQAALSLQAAQTKAANSLRNIGMQGQTATRTVRDITESYDAMGQRGGASTEDLLSGFGRLVGITHSVAAAQKGQTAAVQLSIKYGIDYNTALNAIIQAEGGRYRSIQKYIGIITPVKTATDALHASSKHLTGQQLANVATVDKQATANEVLGMVLRQTAGAHESLQQRVADVRAHFRDLEANIGTALLPTLSKLITATSTVVGWMARHKTIMFALLGAITAVTAVLTIHAAILEVVKAKTIVVSAAMRLMGISAGSAAAGEETAAVATGALAISIRALVSATVIGALITALILIATHWQQTKRIATQAWNAIRQATLAFVHFIEQMATRIWNALTWPFRQGASFIKKTIHSIGGFSVLGIHPFGLLRSGGGMPRRTHFQGGGPVGMDVVPAWLRPEEGVLNRAAMASIGGVAGLNALNYGTAGPGNLQISYAQPIVIRLDSRTLTQAVVQQTLRAAARGPASLVGGALNTGVATQTR